MSMEKTWQNKLATFLKDNSTRVESHKVIIKEDRVLNRTTIYGEKSTLVWDTNRKTKRIETCYLTQEVKNTPKD